MTGIDGTTLTLGFAAFFALLLLAGLYRWRALPARWLQGRIDRRLALHREAAEVLSEALRRARARGDRALFERIVENYRLHHAAAARLDPAGSRDPGTLLDFDAPAVDAEPVRLDRAA